MSGIDYRYLCAGGIVLIWGISLVPYLATRHSELGSGYPAIRAAFAISRQVFSSS